MHRDKLYGGVTKGEVLALTRFRGSEGAPERSFGCRSLGRGCSGWPAVLWEGLIAGCNGRIIKAKSDDG